MKQVNTGLTKTWRVEKSSSPFFKGGKVIISSPQSCSWFDSLIFTGSSFQ
jgi:hypothetical protein